MVCNVATVEGKTEKENDDPESIVTKGGVVSKVEEIEKSEVIPVVAPTESETLMVQTTVRPVRAGSVFEHEREEADVGLPNTTKEGEPALMTAAPIADLTLMV